MNFLRVITLGFFVAYYLVVTQQKEHHCSEC